MTTRWDTFRPVIVEGSPEPSLREMIVKYYEDGLMECDEHAYCACKEDLVGEYTKKYIAQLTKVIDDSKRTD